jgi:hypothetical protein
VDGFNEEEFTLAVLIDFEKAYDSVWREGLLVKLFKSGIQGKMWKWIQNFLDERLAKCLVNNTEGEWFKTNIGLPQGTVISPILFNIYVKDWFEKIVSQRCKFADDSTMWKSGDNLVEVSECIQKDINEIMEWSRKWRININADKTEYCIFFRLKQHPGHTILKLNYKILKYNRNPKLLGVTLDEKLNFGQHILNIERKAGNSLGMLREIKGLGQIKTNLQQFNWFGFTV